VLGITASVGVSYIKVFAKMGSDYKKPDATTEITRQNYRELVWPLPVGNLLFVGRATAKKLFYANIRTIGELAQSDERLIEGMLGKVGLMLRNFAAGLDVSQVLSSDFTYAPKSIGNSTTAPRDLVTERDVEITLAVLCDSVAARLRAERKKCTVVKLSVRNTRLEWYDRQCKVAPTYLDSELFEAAWGLFKRNHPYGGDGRDIEPIRSIGICGSSLVSEADEQLSLFDGVTTERARLESLSRTVDALRGRYGQHALRRALELEDTRLSGFCPRDEHVIHPERFGR
jgi:DNA polymerase-4